MTPKKRGSTGRGSRIRGGRPSKPKRKVAQRKASRSVSRRGASANLSAKRSAKRQQSRKRVAAVSSRPRPTARPKKTPSRAMSAARKPIRPSRTARPSPRQIKRSARSSAGKAAAAGAFLTLLSSAAVPKEHSLDVSALRSSLDDLQERSSFTELQADIANLDANLNHVMSLLESARDRGYKYQKDLEDIAYDAMSRWQKIRDDVENKVTTQTDTFQNKLGPVNASVKKLNVALSSGKITASSLGSAQREVDRALGSLADAQRAIEKAYSGIETKSYQLTSRLTRIHWVLDQVDEATFELGDKEEIYMVVKARWDQEGKDDPEGALFLTNQNLIFERKEKIATKKLLFITTASELVQEKMLSAALKDVKGLKARHKGLFGNQDFLDVNMAGEKVPFHINGQDSKDWVQMIKNAISGKIEDDRATGSGLSFAELTGEITLADILELQQEVNELQDEMMLKDAQEELSEIENQMGTIVRELAELRARGYVVEKSLEADIEVLSSQWKKINRRASATIKFQTKQLSGQMKTIQELVGTLAAMSGDLAAARPRYIQVKSKIASAEAQAEAAEATVFDQYDEYADEVAALDAHLEWVDWMLDALETASFKLLATESGVSAVEAIWDRSGVEPQNGILYLTDQRLIWEDRQGEFVVKLEVPIANIEDVKEEEKDETESLVFSFSTDAPVNKARFNLDLPVADGWVQMVGRARSGRYADDRAVKIDKAELDRIRNAPGQCSNCGAGFTAPVLRGQNEITCEFCGVVTRI